MVRSWVFWFYVFVGLVFILAYIGNGYVSGYLGTTLVATRVYADDAPATITPGVVEAMKGDVLDRLSKCESGGKETNIVFDSNHRASVGNFQWQASSFQFYWEKMTGEKLSERAAIVKALDDEEARKLAAYVIFDLKVAPSKDWFRCSQRDNLDTLAQFINEYE